MQEEYLVYLGEYIMHKTSEILPRQKMCVKKVVRHPWYDWSPQADRYDVGLLQLDKPATMMPHVSPICLPDPTIPIFGGIKAYVSGWGNLKVQDQNRPETLQSVAVFTLNNSVCERWYRNAGQMWSIYGEMICAGYKEGGKDACQGDSGGPLMTKVGMK